MGNNTRETKGISFTNEYREELNKLNNEENGSKLVCKLLREHYSDKYSISNVEDDMVHIKEVLEDIRKRLGGNL